VVLQITPSERTALQLLANGMAMSELARQLGIGECQIEAHLATLFARMGAAGRTDAIAAALRRGLLISSDRPMSVHSRGQRHQHECKAGGPAELV